MDEGQRFNGQEGMVLLAHTREYLPIRRRGRKVKELSEKEKVIVREAKMRYKLGEGDWRR